MKTTASFFTKITMGLLIAGSIAACSKNKSAETTASTTPPSADKEAIVYVNSDTLLTKYEYAKDIAKRLEAKGKSAQDDLAARGQSFQREVAEYQKNQATLSADQRQSTEARLQRTQESLQTYQQNATAEFQNSQATENGKLYDKIADLTKAYAKEKGYKMILTYSKASPTVLYGDASLDVTIDVLKKLNDAYANEKK